MHILDYMTAPERERYFKGRAERMAKANLLEKFRLWLHPWHHIFFMLGFAIAITMYGLPIGFCMVCMACWIQGSGGKWSFLLSLPFALANLALLLAAGVTLLVR